jgi:hypothetical protein
MRCPLLLALAREADALRPQQRLHVLGLVARNDGDAIGRGKRARRPYDMLNHREAAGAMQDLRLPRTHADAETRRKNHNPDIHG